MGEVSLNSISAAMDNESFVSIHKTSLSALPSIRQLRAFLSVYYTGSVSAAAQELSVTQPAVTVMLRELEEKLGLKLFDRSTRSLRRTEAASKAIGYAERALAELSAMAGAMSQISGLQEGRVRVAATAAVAQTLLAPAMRSFQLSHPGIKIDIDEVAPGDFVEAVLTERVDIGVGTLESPVSGLQVNVLLREPLVAAGKDLDKVHAGASMTWKQLAVLPLVTVRFGYGIRARIEAAAQEAGVMLKIEHEVSLLRTAVALAANGLGIVVAPESMVMHQPGLVTRRLIRPKVERVIGIVSKRGTSLSPAGHAFVETLRTEIPGRKHPFP